MAGYGALMCSISFVEWALPTKLGKPDPQTSSNPESPSHASAAHLAPGAPRLDLRDARSVAKDPEDDAVVNCGDAAARRAAAREAQQQRVRPAATRTCGH